MAEDLKKLTEQMYGANLDGQKATLKADYDTSVSDLGANQEAQRQRTNQNLNAAYSDAARSQKNWGEVQNAYGLSSGTNAQARLSQENNLNTNLNNIRLAQDTADREVERQRMVLSQKYQAAIQEAQANNDMQKAQQLFKLAQEDEDRLRDDRLNAAQLMAGVGDYSLYGSLYGLTPEQIAALRAEYDKKNSGGGGYYGGGGGSSTDATDAASLLSALTGAAKTLSPKVAAVDALWERGSNTPNSGYTPTKVKTSNGTVTKTK